MKLSVPAIDQSCALLLIDVQKGFLDPSWGRRNNPEAERNIRQLLAAFRTNALPIIHVHHLSEEEQSPLRPGQAGVEPMEECEPKLGERIFQKTVNSAFIGTGLENYLKMNSIRSLVMVGFTTDHCVSTSTRMAANLGFTVLIAADATFAFERRGSKSPYTAELVHDVSLASLNKEFASLYTTQEIALYCAKVDKK